MTAGPNLCFMFDRAPELAAIGDGDELAVLTVLSWHWGDGRKVLGGVCGWFFSTVVRYIHDGLRVESLNLLFLSENWSDNCSWLKPHGLYFLYSYHCFPLFYATNLHDDSSTRSCVSGTAIGFIGFCWRAFMSPIKDIYSCCFYHLQRRYWRESSSCSTKGDRKRHLLVNIGRRA